MRLIVGITGASGARYALRLIERLADCESLERLAVVMTDNAQRVAAHELPAGEFSVLNHPKVVRYPNDDLFVPIASGSAHWDAMVILPASMGAVGRIAAGLSGDLLARAADVMLKEGRRLIVCPRETPLSLIHLRNLTALAEAGATILPCMPSFYNGEASVGELVDSVVERILAQLGLPTRKGWQE